MHVSGLNQVKDELILIKDLEVLPNYDITSFTSFKLKSIRDVLIVKSVAALKSVLKILSRENIEYVVISGGSNFISVKSSILLKIELDDNKETLKKYQDIYKLSSTVMIGQLTAHAIKNGNIGWEVFTGIPASLGGAVYMNAGTRLGEIGDLIESVDVITRYGDEYTYLLNDLSFSYRKNNFLRDGDIIVGVSIRSKGQDLINVPKKIKDYLEYRKQTQPLGTKNCGCVFKNPSPERPAGKIIDDLGLKGYEYHGLRVSNKHANFIENENNASVDDFWALISIIKNRVYQEYAIEFELEVKCL